MQTNLYRIAGGLTVAALIVGVGVYWWKWQFDVSGHVTYNGSPLDKPGGQVVFVGPDGAQSAAPIGPDGAYRVARVPAGLNRVAVYYPNPMVQKLKQRPALGEPPLAPIAPFLTPFPYAAVETSGIEVQVANDTVFDIELTGPPIP